MSKKGLPFIGKLNDFIEKVLHPTVQKVGNSRAALDVIHRGYYILNPSPTVGYVVEAGSDDNLVVLTAHGFKPGDLIRLETTANAISEYEITIDEIVDANSFKLAGYLSASLTAGDTFFALRPTSERFSADGSTLASLSPAPIYYNRKVGGVTTLTAALEDKDTPGNSRAIPVVLHGLDAANITVTSNQLDVSLSHADDSVKLGDGTNFVNVNSSHELQVKDDSANTTLSSINGKDFATETTLASINGKDFATQTTLAALLTELQGKADLVETQPVSLASAPLPTGAATETTLSSLLTELQGKADLTETQPVNIQNASIAVTGTVTANLGTIAGVATESTLSTLNGKIPSNLTVTSTRLLVDGSGVTQPISIAAAVKQYGTARSTSYDEYLTLTTVQTFTAPSNAVGALIQASDTNTANIRFRTGTATTTSGIQLQPGRSETLYGGTSITVVSESGTNAVSILWFVEAQS